MASSTEHGSRPKSASPSASTRLMVAARSSPGQPRLDRLHAGLLRGVHDVVDVPLGRGEPAGDRQGPGDVGGVEVPALHPHVGQEQLTRS